MKKKRSRELLTPDITPLIDVVFLLLIFFMVSTVFKKDELALLLQLPKAEIGQSVQGKPILNLNIEMSAQDLALNGSKTTFEQLPIKLKEIKNKMIPVEIRIDKEVAYERVIRLLDNLKKFNLNNLALITDN